jgi:hypothetical protein
MTPAHSQLAVRNAAGIFDIFGAASLRRHAENPDAVVHCLGTDQASLRLALPAFG